MVTYGTLGKYLEESMKDMTQKPIWSVVGNQILSLAITMSSTQDPHSYVEEIKTIFAQRINGSSIFDIYDCSRIIRELQSILGEESFVDDSINKSLLIQMCGAPDIKFSNIGMGDRYLFLLIYKRIRWR
ncbi:MAG TPA: hypothetical protein VFD60_10330 [Nitrososphaeraceae archaeon]|jgi:hypothetical protein|nr:hypothetical protein [Nitrososphaeraceae archaeon]